MRGCYTRLTQRLQSPIPPTRNLRDAFHHSQRMESGVDEARLDEYTTRLLTLLAARYPTELDKCLSETLKHLDAKRGQGEVCGY